MSGLMELFLKAPPSVFKDSNKKIENVPDMYMKFREGDNLPKFGVKENVDLGNLLLGIKAMQNNTHRDRVIDPNNVDLGLDFNYDLGSGHSVFGDANMRPRRRGYNGEFEIPGRDANAADFQFGYQYKF